MPEILDRCVAKVMGKGHSEDSAYAICRESLGLEDDEDEGPDIDDDEMDMRIENEMARRQFYNGPSYRKWMAVAREIGSFKNGPYEGDLSKGTIDEILANYKTSPKVPVFLWDHVEDLDERPPDGWVEDIRRKDGILEAFIKLHGEAVGFLVRDQIRGASIAWSPEAVDYKGRKIGARLTHVTLTNKGYIKDIPSIGEALTMGRESLQFAFTALEEGDMPEDTEVKKLKDQLAAKDVEITALKDKLKKQVTPTDKETATKLKEQEDKIIELKAADLRKTKEIEALREQLANSADKDKDAALIENKNLKRDAFLRDVRTVVEYGLHKGTLLASEVDGYAGAHPLDLRATERWLKASEFYDESMPDPEMFAFNTIKHLATKTKPRVTIGTRYNSGRPKDDETITLSEDEKQRLREQGYDPERIAHMKDDTSYAEWSRLPKTAAAK